MNVEVTQHDPAVAARIVLHSWNLLLLTSANRNLTEIVHFYHAAAPLAPFLFLYCLFLFPYSFIVAPVACCFTEFHGTPPMLLFDPTPHDVRCLLSPFRSPGRFQYFPFFFSGTDSP